jgi:hypothetical protein
MNYWNVTTSSTTLAPHSQLMFWPDEDPPTFPPLQVGDAVKIQAQDGGDVFSKISTGSVTAAQSTEAIIEVDARRWRIRMATSSDTIEQSLRHGKFKTWIVVEAVT